MKLSARAQAALQRATNAFVQQVADLVVGETVTTGPPPRADQRRPAAASTQSWTTCASLRQRRHGGAPRRAAPRGRRRGDAQGRLEGVRPLAAAAASAR